MTKVAVILSGCGYLDGAEVHESVLTLLALTQAGLEYHCFAPDMPQRSVVNHLSGEEVAGEERNALVEAARIARGKIQPLSSLKAADFDAIMIPGGFGAAKNLCTFAFDQKNFEVDEDLKAQLLAFYEEKKPIAATCIAPVILAKSFEGKASLTMTLGQDSESLSHLSRMGMKAESAPAAAAVLDRENKVYTTPCYMEPDDLAGMFEGIKKVVQELKDV